MRSIIKIISRIKWDILAILNPMSFAKRYGVNFGKGCRFIGCNSKTFGSEPYLINLGDYVSLSEGVRFITHDGGVWVIRNKYAEHESVDLFGKITVGSNVFIGMNVTLLPGVNIGSGCVIGTGTVITKDIPENSVVAGVPGRVISDVDKYLLKNKHKFINTKHLSNAEKKEIILQ